MEAVKQGSACVGLKSPKFAVICALKRSSNDLGSFQKKIFKIDDHIGIAIAGLTADARVLSKYMRNECLNYKFVYEAPLQTSRLVSSIADKSQTHTQRYGKRPYGVGLLVIGYDQTGAHLYETCPSGNYWDWRAISIGARSQSAKTYLERKFEGFDALSLEELVIEALQALNETTGQDNEALTIKNCSIGIVGKDTPFEILEGAKLKPYLDRLETKPTTAATTTSSGASGALAGAATSTMETS